MTKHPLRAQHTMPATPPSPRISNGGPDELPCRLQDLDCPTRYQFAAYVYERSKDGSGRGYILLALPKSQDSYWLWDLSHAAGERPTWRANNRSTGLGRYTRAALRRVLTAPPPAWIAEKQIDGAVFRRFSVHAHQVAIAMNHWDVADDPTLRKGGEIVPHGVPTTADVDRISREHGIGRQGYLAHGAEQASGITLEDVIFCVEWLRTYCRTTNTITSRSPDSYGMKHVMERHTGRYVGNGAFIVAAIFSGLSVRRAGRNSPNAAMNLTSTSGGLA